MSSTLHTLGKGESINGVTVFDPNPPEPPKRGNPYGQMTQEDAIKHELAVMIVMITDAIDQFRNCPSCNVTIEHTVLNGSRHVRIFKTSTYKVRRIEVKPFSHFFPPQRAQIEAHIGRELARIKAEDIQTPAKPRPYPMAHFSYPRGNHGD